MTQPDCGLPRRDAPIVVVGAGLAGYSVVREIRRLDSQVPVLLFARDSAAYYSKPTLSHAVSRGKSAAQLGSATAGGMAAQLGVEIRPDSQLESIDTARGRIQVNGRMHDYASLVLALGAEPRKPRLDGLPASAIHCINDLQDYARFEANRPAGKRIAIFGAGLIGCEFANDLAVAGCTVHVFDIAKRPLAALLPAAFSHALMEAMADLPVHWHLGNQATRCVAGQRTYRIELRGGRAVEVDVVLGAVGLLPRVEVARAAGLNTGRGIIVDPHLRTSCSDVYALGDCAEICGHTLPYVLPIMHAARALARTLCVEDTPVAFPAMPVVVKTPALPMCVLPPTAGVPGEWEVEPAASGSRAWFVARTNGERIGFALAGGAVVERAALEREFAGPCLDAVPA